MYFKTSLWMERKGNLCEKQKHDKEGQDEKEEGKVELKRKKKTIKKIKHVRIFEGKNVKNHYEWKEKRAYVKTKD